MTETTEKCCSASRACVKLCCWTAFCPDLLLHSFQPAAALHLSPSFTGLVSDSTCAGVHGRPAAETLAPFTPRLWDIPQLWTGWSSETVGRGGKEQETLTGSYCRRQREGEGLKVGFPDPLKEVHWALSRQRLWVQMRMEGWMWMVYVLAALFHQVGHPQTFTLSKLLF